MRPECRDTHAEFQALKFRLQLSLPEKAILLSASGYSQQQHRLFGNSPSLCCCCSPLRAQEDTFRIEEAFPCPKTIFRRAKTPAIYCPESRLAFESFLSARSRRPPPQDSRSVSGFGKIGRRVSSVLLVGRASLHLSGQCTVSEWIYKLNTPMCVVEVYKAKC